MNTRKNNCTQCQYHYHDGFMDGRQKMYNEIDRAVRGVWISSDYIAIRESLKYVESSDKPGNKSTLAIDLWTRMLEKYGDLIDCDMIPSVFEAALKKWREALKSQGD